MFQLDHVAEIRAINISRAKNDEAPVVATISLDFDSVGREPVAVALGCREEDLDAFFGEPGDCRFTSITDIASWAKYEDRHTLKMLGFSCDVSKVNAIKLKPRNTTSFELSCNIQLQDPPEHVIEKIVAALHDSVTVKLTQDAELPLEQREEEKEAA